MDNLYTECKKGHPVQPGRRCKICGAEMAHRSRLKNPDKTLDYQLRYNYGIGIEDYNRMLSQQQGRCAICHKLPRKRRLGVDHNHRTGVIRGLLCHRCNRGLAALNDNYDTITAAGSYVSRSLWQELLGVSQRVPDSILTRPKRKRK